MNPIAYIQGVLAELRRVNWPSAATVVGHFFSVVIGVGVATCIIFAMDYVFLQGIQLIIK